MKNARASRATMMIELVYIMFAHQSMSALVTDSLHKCLVVVVVVRFLDVPFDIWCFESVVFSCSIVISSPEISLIDKKF